MADKTRYLQYADMLLRLKLENLPSIAQEVEGIEKKYASSLFFIRTR